MLKAEESDSNIEWFTRVANVCMNERKVPRDWQRVVMVLLYKERSLEGKCKNYKERSLLSIPGELYGREVIKSERTNKWP